MQTITMWAEEDRPREKLLMRGINALSDVELIAILIGSGTVGADAVTLARNILSGVSLSLHELGRQSVSDLQKFKGIGPAKAVTIAAALELGRRRQMSDLRERPRISSSRDAFQLVSTLLSDLHHEEFWVLLLNQANEVRERKLISKGGMTATVVDIRDFFRSALEGRAAAVIAVHNHPSGNLKPSQADISLTKRLAEAGKLVEIPLLDHLIISERGYFSFADEGMI